MKTLTSILTTLVLLATTACGGDGAGLPDARTLADADDTDAVPQACTVVATGYGDLGLLDTGNATLGPQSANPAQDYIEFFEPVNQDAAFDAIRLSFWENFGALPLDFVANYPFTVPITGAETSFATCGTCIEIYGDVVNGTATQDFMAQSGSITIDALDPTVGTGRITGTITNITFAHVAMGVVVNDGCTTVVDAMAFDLPIVMR